MRVRSDNGYFLVMLLGIVFIAMVDATSRVKMNAKYDNVHVRLKDRSMSEFIILSIICYN